jgi:hypothetical protein
LRRDHRSSDSTAGLASISTRLPASGRAMSLKPAIAVWRRTKSTRGLARRFRSSSGQRCPEGETAPKRFLDPEGRGFPLGLRGFAVFPSTPEPDSGRPAHTASPSRIRAFQRTATLGGDRLRIDR